MIDLPLLGRKFTWFQPNIRCLSRIDRVLVSNQWLVVVGDSSVRDVSDHFPIVRRWDYHDWGPKKFRIIIIGLLYKEFNFIIERSWRNGPS